MLGPPNLCVAFNRKSKQGEGTKQLSRSASPSSANLVAPGRQYEHNITPIGTLVNTDLALKILRSDIDPKMRGFSVVIELFLHEHFFGIFHQNLCYT